MEKIELKIPIENGNRILFSGRVDFCGLYHVNSLEGESWTVKLYFSKFPVWQMTVNFYPAMVVQQIIKQGIDLETFHASKLSIEDLQILLDQSKNFKHD